MVLPSTFPNLSEDEALRELHLNGGSDDAGGSSGSTPYSSTLPPLLAHHGRLAGWVSGLPDTTNTSASSSTAVQAVSSPAHKSQTDRGSGTSPEGNRADSGGGEGGEGPTIGPTELSFSAAGADGGPALTASRAIRRGDVVAAERPLAAAQSSQTLPWVAACPGCLRHVGTLDTQLAVASGKLDRAEAFRFESGITEPATVAAAAAEAGPPPKSPVPAVPEAAACSPRSEDRREGDGEGGGGGEGFGRSGEGAEGARLPPLEDLSERFSQVGETWG